MASLVQTDGIVPQAEVPSTNPETEKKAAEYPAQEEGGSLSDVNLPVANLIAPLEEQVNEFSSSLQGAAVDTIGKQYHDYLRQNPEASILTVPQAVVADEEVLSRADTRILYDDKSLGQLEPGYNDKSLSQQNQTKEYLQNIAIEKGADPKQLRSDIASEYRAQNPDTELYSIPAALKRYQDNPDFGNTDKAISVMSDNGAITELSDNWASTPESKDETMRQVANDFLAEPSNKQKLSAMRVQQETLDSLQKGYDLDELFNGGSDSIVAKTIGSAEGTRAASGIPTRAYYGHVDPGNGVWNMGSFSYQHGAASPQDADAKQLKRLKGQGLELERQIAAKGSSFSRDEFLNGLDLANQAPLAALDRGGYVDRLMEARDLYPDDEAARIKWARTYSYISPNTGNWAAPGLGNTRDSIYRDQTRRHDAIARVLGHEAS